MNESESHEFEDDELEEVEVSDADEAELEHEELEDEDLSSDDSGSMEAESLDHKESEHEEGEHEEGDKEEANANLSEASNQESNDQAIRMDQADEAVPQAVGVDSQSQLIDSLAPESLEPVEIEPDLKRDFSTPPIGIRRANAEGLEIYDGSTGLASVFGFGFDPIAESIQAAAEGYLGAGICNSTSPSGDDNLLREELAEYTGGSIDADSVFLRPSADDAVETAIELARRYRPNRYRTIAIVGSDHGRTGLCRTASGRPELHEGFGPMMAGFAHVPSGDLNAMQKSIDDNTTCVLMSPVDLGDAARPIDADYLIGVRQLCNEHGLLLIMDETQLMFGSSGQPLAYSSIADVRADIVVLAGGLFGGLPGGIVVASEHVTNKPVLDTNRYPLLAAVATETLSSMKQQQLPELAEESMQDFAVALAENLSGFEFVRDVNVLGATIGIEFDIDSRVVVRAAARKAIRLHASGNSSVRLQLPLVLVEEDQNTILTRLGASMEIIEREAAELTV